MQSSRCPLSTILESTICPWHLWVPWHSLAGQLWWKAHLRKNIEFGNILLTISARWCILDRVLHLDVQILCSWKRACTLNVLVPMTTTHSHHFYHKFCGKTPGQELSPGKWQNIPGFKKRVFNTAISINKLETNLALSIHIALIFLRNPYDSSLPLLWRYVKRKRNLIAPPNCYATFNCSKLEGK